MRKLITFVALLFSFSINAQTLQTKSSCDSNADGKVSIEDVTNTTNKILGKPTSEKNVVTAEDLNALLQSIDEKLTELKQTQTSIQDIQNRLIYLEKSGVYSYPFENGHEYVDLGLSVKWATCNIGAESPLQLGNYYAWAETEPKNNYDYRYYKYRSPNFPYYNWGSIGKYTFPDKSSYGCWYENGIFVGDNKTVLEPEDDAAYVNLHGKWRTPTAEELNELIENCNWVWTSLNHEGINVSGYVVISNITGNSIFLPAGGYYEGTSLRDKEKGFYWTSSAGTDMACRTVFLEFSSSRVDKTSHDRPYGRLIRPVCP